MKIETCFEHSKPFSKCVFNHKHCFEFLNISANINIFWISVILKMQIIFKNWKNNFIMVFLDSNIFSVSNKFGTGIKLKVPNIFGKGTNLEIVKI